MMVVQIQLIRIELRVPEYGWTTQKVFHLMNFIVNGGNTPKSVRLLLCPSAVIYLFMLSFLFSFRLKKNFSACNCIWTSQASLYIASKGECAEFLLLWITNLSCLCLNYTCCCGTWLL